MRHLLRLLLGLLLALLAVAKSDKPNVEETPFDHSPQSLIFFEDSDTYLLTTYEPPRTYRSDDGGFTFTEIEDVRDKVVEVLKHPFDKETAIILGTHEHRITRDRGKTWTTFESEVIPSIRRPGIVFHATDPSRMLFQAEECISVFCEDVVYYTTDAFETAPKLLSEDVVSCTWAKSTDIFTTGDDDLDKNRVLCIAKGKYDIFTARYRAVISDDFFETDPWEPVMSSGQTIEGVTNVAAVKKYIVFAARGESSTEMAMYVTDDTKTWHRAEFGQHRLDEGAYTLLESTNYSMQVDVMTSWPQNPMGVLLTSNSNGTFFTKNIEHTNRAKRGYVDFEKISNIQGIVLVNTVSNFEEVERKGFTAQKEIVSNISFDDGRTWESMKVVGKDSKDGKTLHLHSVTSQRNVGRIFSSPAPGIVMGVGNTGDYLKDYEDGHTYVSDDAGLTWTLALEKPHIYEFGAQGSILVAVEDAETDEIRWSLDHGKTWDTVELEDKIRPTMLTTTPDSTSLKFTLVAHRGDKYVVYGLDFKGLHARECKSKDLEKWPARVDEGGKATCIMGHKQFFMRRKADAECLMVSKDFEDPEEDRERCDCTEQDFECDYNFRMEDGKCVQVGPIHPPEGACEAGDTKFTGTSGYRLIPGNDCRVKDVDLAKEIERPCTDTTSPPASGEIAAEVTTFFDAGTIVEYFYLERAVHSGGDDETIVMRTKTGYVYKTHDHGKKWVRILEDEFVQAIYPHQYNNDRVYFITEGKEVHYSANRLYDLHHFKVDDEPASGVQVLTFHPNEPDWLIWAGRRDCNSQGEHCLTVAAISTDAGDDWKTLLHGVRKCQFVYREDRLDSNDLTYCEQYEDQDPKKSIILWSSSDKFEHKTELKRDVINFATMAEFIVVAVRDQEKDSLKVDTSIDGVTFADAQFPYDFRPEHQTAYTVLDSSSHAIFLHVTTNDQEGQEAGNIIKSNSNGTHYVLSASDVNRNKPGYVDFEKMQGLEGVAVINRVVNAKALRNGKDKSKKLQTYITHNDGAGWELLGRPKDPPKDQGKGYGCKESTDKSKCSLHLHGYTERVDTRHTYSSPGAIGLMMATGNVGDSLGPKKDADTFITRDAGLTWNWVAEGAWTWEYGDLGSILVIVKQFETTDIVRYSLDEGKTWKEFNFGENMKVDSLTTVPSDSSRNFLLWGTIGGEPATVRLDFSGLRERSRQCKLDESSKSDTDDYVLWSPRHPMMEDDCLFGHVAQYHRKKPESDCYNGLLLESQVSHLHNIDRNCSCTREDFECDFNYEPDGTNSCKLVNGYKKPDPAEVCKKNPDLIEYNGVTGYRRIPLTTCQGGKELDRTSTKYPCPTKEDEFNKKHGISGVALFFAIVLPIAAAAGVGYWVWKNWDGKFGQIRLGDGGAASFGGAFDGDAPWIKYPVMLVSGIVAVIAATPMLVGSIWRTISMRLGRSGGHHHPYTTRDSFTRGRGDYAVVDEDEGELLGESDLDEDV